MQHAGNGWYVCVAPHEGVAVATALFGPFDTEAEVHAWMTDYSITYKPDRPAFSRPVPAFSEMVDESFADHEYQPWATKVHHRD